MNWEIIILNSAILTALGVIGYFLKDIKSSLKEKIDENKGKIREVEKDLQELKEDLPQKFVMREDYLRGMSMVISKLDNLNNGQSEIKERLAGIERGQK